MLRGAIVTRKLDSTVNVKELSYEIIVWKGTSVEELLILINSYDQ
jgi:hypothetical protein